MGIAFGIFSGLIVTVWFLFLEFQDDVCDFWGIEKEFLPSWMIIKDKKEKNKKIQDKGVWNK